MTPAAVVRYKPLWILSCHSVAGAEQMTHLFRFLPLNIDVFILLQPWDSRQLLVRLCILPS
eukprot:8246746-Karenia_brevis.AAC.1